MLLAVTGYTAQAGDVTIPKTFTADTPAKAEDVNANFNAVATAVNGTATDVAALKIAVKAIPAGPQGPAGPNGVSGPAGPAGPQGPAGPVGPVGANGATGATGAQGPQGLKGAAGPPGAQGPSGTNGTNGTNGVGFTFRNAWNNSTAYAANDVVTESGAVYVAVAANSGVDPVSDVGLLSTFSQNTMGRAQLDPGWIPETIAFTATSTTTQVSFQSLNGANGTVYGPLLDGVSLASAAAPGTNLLVNGSFESASGCIAGTTSLPGWTVSAGNIDIGGPTCAYPDPAADGTYFIDLTGSFGAGAGTIYQNVATQIGTRYTLTFFFGANAQWQYHP
jgi:hypothetical protein